MVYKSMSVRYHAQTADQQHARQSHVPVFTAPPESLPKGRSQQH